MSRFIAPLVMLCVAASSGSSAAEPISEDWVKDAASQTVFFAVVEGLFVDGVSKEHVDLILPPDKDVGEHFVYACPLCHPAIEALRLYRAHPHFEFDKPIRWIRDGQVPVLQSHFGKGLDETTAQRLASKDRNERIAVIQELIRRWVARRINSMCLTAERTVWQAHFERQRKVGMARLEAAQNEASSKVRYQDRKICPACDGSTAACETPAEPSVASLPAPDSRQLLPDVFFAVLEELYRGGVSNEDLELILPGDRNKQRSTFTDHFVYSCQLCHSAWEALRLYKSRPAFAFRKAKEDTFGTGLDPAIAALLRNGDRAKRLEGIQKLVTLGISKRLERQRLNEPEKLKWAAYLEGKRNDGMKKLEAFQKQERDGSYDYVGWKYCPSCDGSSAACKLPKPDPMPKPKSDPNF